MTRVNLRDLVSVMVNLYSRMGKEEYGPDLNKNEELTRYILVDPILRALGWDTENPKSVYVQYRVSGRTNRVDYALFRKGKLVAFVEAKKFGTCYDLRSEEFQKDARQLVTYCSYKGLSTGMITDGGRWLVYDINKPVSFEQKMVLDVNFGSNEEDKEKARKLLKLCPSNIEGLLTEYI